MNRIITARVYEDLSEFSGKRVLVDRLWPRGKKKETLALDLWAKEVSPSTELRKKYDHTAEAFPAFQEEYLLELKENPNAQVFVETMEQYLAGEDILFLYASKTADFNNAVVLKEWLEDQLTKRRKKQPEK